MSEHDCKQTILLNQIIHTMNIQLAKTENISSQLVDFFARIDEKEKIRLIREKKLEDDIIDIKKILENTSFKSITDNFSKRYGTESKFTGIELFPIILEKKAAELELIQDVKKKFKSKIIDISLYILTHHIPILIINLIVILSVLYVSAKKNNVDFFAVLRVIFNLK